MGLPKRKVNLCNADLVFLTLGMSFYIPCLYSKFWFVGASLWAGRAKFYKKNNAGESWVNCHCRGTMKEKITNRFFLLKKGTLAPSNSLLLDVDYITTGEKCPDQTYFSPDVL